VRVRTGSLTQSGFRGRLNVLVDDAGIARFRACEDHSIAPVARMIA